MQHAVLEPPEAQVHEVGGVALLQPPGAGLALLGEDRQGPLHVAGGEIEEGPLGDARVAAGRDDLFAAIRSGKASVATGAIERFTPGGLRLEDGTQIPADIVVAATGLKVELAGGMELHKDGAPVRLADAMAYKGLLFSGVPNFASIFGYTNASWTLKADLSAAFLCRLLNRLRRRGDTVVVPRRDHGVAERPFLDFTSGYVQRALPLLPKQGETGPWRLKQSYAADLMNLRFGRVADGVLDFSK